MAEYHVLLRMTKIHLERYWNKWHKIILYFFFAKHYTSITSYFTFPPHWWYTFKGFKNFEWTEVMGVPPKKHSMNCLPFLMHRSSYFEEEEKHILNSEWVELFFQQIGKQVLFATFPLWFSIIIMYFNQIKLGGRKA